MIPDLRARLKAVADKPKQAASKATCEVLESRIPARTLAAGQGRLPDAIMPEHIRMLGLDHPAFDLRRALFLDTETTGLRGAGTIAFLVGLGWLEPGAEGDVFVVRQLLMRDYPEELDQLQCLADLLPRFTSIVSFNGRSFDVPLLRDRFVMARMRPAPLELPHLDLLHTARRTWKLRLGKCTLGNLEAQVLGCPREDDLPGAEVPERYFQFLKTGDRVLLDDILRHNEQDIRTLYVLLCRLASAYMHPEAQTSMLDVYSIGRALDRCGEGCRARRCYQVASVSDLSRQARLSMAESFRRERDYAAAAETYQGMIRRGEADADAYVALAIIQERYLRDVSGALQTTEQALWRFSGNSFLHPASRETIAALQRRRARLRRRVDTRSAVRDCPGDA